MKFVRLPSGSSAAKCQGMKPLFSILTVCALVGFSAVAADEELKPLFNGKDLTGFKTEGNWVVEEDGVIAIKPREGEKGWKRYGSYLWAETQYGDFVAEVEYKHPKGGNSGVFFRCSNLADPVTDGLEVQILDSHGKAEPLGHHDCGGVIRTAGPSKNMAKPAGEWNHMKITAKGTKLQVELNGEQIIDIDLAETESKDKPLKGYFGLQDHGQLMWFRNIKIKAL
ncbi:MAG: hypothetical protein ACI8UO_001574 [Verrucomicrobiales bacterium]|jgi:hypothetical protein